MHGQSMEGRKDRGRTRTVVGAFAPERFAQAHVYARAWRNGNRDARGSCRAVAGGDAATSAGRAERGGGRLRGLRARRCVLPRYTRSRDAVSRRGGSCTWYGDQMETISAMDPRGRRTHGKPCGGKALCGREPFMTIFENKGATRQKGRSPSVPRQDLALDLRQLVER